MHLPPFFSLYAEEARHGPQHVGGRRYDRRVSGRLSRKTLPYCLVTMRGSRISTTPVSSWRRMSRPNPCRMRTTASGKGKLAEGIAAALLDGGHARLEHRLGGTRNGSRHRMTICSVSPGASTPSQNESVAKRTLERSARNESRSRARSSSPCFMTRMPARQAPAAPPHRRPAAGCTR